jgi:hypothetical protein
MHETNINNGGEKGETRKRNEWTFIPMDKFSTALSGLILFFASVMFLSGFTVPFAASDILIRHEGLVKGCCCDIVVAQVRELTTKEG